MPLKTLSSSPGELRNSDRAGLQGRWHPETEQMSTSQTLPGWKIRPFHAASWRGPELVENKPFIPQAIFSDKDQLRALASVVRTLLVVRDYVCQLGVPTDEPVGFLGHILRGALRLRRRLHRDLDE